MISEVSFASSLALSLLVALCGVSPAGAQTYPTRPIRAIVPFEPGGANDLSCRSVATRLAEALKTPVLVVNRPGAGAQIGIAEVVRAAPDGYTLLCAPGGPLTITPAVQKLPYDVIKDLVPVAMLTRGALGIAVNAAVPIQSLAGLVKASKERPEGLHYSVPAIGTNPQMAGELFKQLSGANLTAVPFKGNAPSVTALLSGEVPASISDLVSLVPHAKSGRIRILAVSSASRSIIAPDVPTLAEAGYPDATMHSWYGLFAPVGTSAAIVERLNAEVAVVLAVPEVRSAFLPNGLDVNPMRPEEMRRTMVEDLRKWTAVVKKSNMRIE